MPLESFRQWIRRIYATNEDELDCDEFFGIVAQYVDLQVAGQDADSRFPAVKHHLEQCSECYELYVALSELARAETQAVSVKLNAFEYSQEPDSSSDGQRLF